MPRIRAYGRCMLGTLALALLALPAHDSRAAGEATVIELSQTGCQFVEPEGADHGYRTSKAMDCVEVNSATGMERLAKVEPLVLKPGKYIFRVTNVNVPYELGYYLRASSRLKIPFKPKVAGGGLHAGVTKDYEIELEEGEYVYSCPLNPTPDYPLLVKD